MALLFCDGFDHYSTDDITKKWDSASGATISNSGRNNNCVSIPSLISFPHITKSFNDRNTVVVGMAIKVTSFRSGSGDSCILRFLDDSNLHIEIRLSSPDHFLCAYRGTTLLGMSNFAPQLNQWCYVEVKVLISNTVGKVIIQANNDIILNLTDIDTNSGGRDYCNKISVVTYQTAILVDDLYIDGSDFLGDIKIETLYPSGAGTTKQWDASAGDNYECVDETPLNSDTDYVSTATANEIDTYAFGNLATTAGTVYGVQVNMVARKDDAGSRSIAPVVRPASTDRVGDTVSIGDSYMNYTQMYNTNPEDSEAWEIADVNGAEFGIKCIS